MPCNLLSRRDSPIVGRHEVPGIMTKIAPSPAGRLNRFGLETIHGIQNQVEQHRGRIFPLEYLAFLKRHEPRFDDKLPLELTMPSTGPSGTGSLCISTQALRAWLQSACPSGTKAIRPSQRLTIIFALMGLDRPKFCLS